MNENQNKRVKSESQQEMEQIQKGLEEFLSRELNIMDVQRNKQPSQKSYRVPDEIIGDDVTGDTVWGDDGEKDNGEDITVVKEAIGYRDAEDDYTEDWDSEEFYNRTGQKEEMSNTERKNPGKREIKQGKSGKKQEKIMQGKSMQEQTKQHKKSRKKKRRKSRFLKVIIVVAVLAMLVCGGLYYVVGVVYAKMNYVGIDSVATAPIKEEGVVNILLIGNDSRENGEDGRSDAMILLSISDKTKKIYMTSLLRDMYVEIPGYKGNRLNAAYSYGGAELLMETIELNLDIDVNRYVLVNFEAFAKLVDAVGGIELELTSGEIEYVNAYLVEYNMLTDRPQGTDNMDTSVSGLVHLNGPQALAYTRNRYMGTDFGRTERQRKVLTAVIQKAPKALLSNPKELIDGLMPNLTTNLTQPECFQLSFMAPKLITYEMVQNSIPIEGSYKNATIREMSVLEVDFEANKQYLRENVYGEGTQIQE